METIDETWIETLQQKLQNGKFYCRDASKMVDSRKNARMEVFATSIGRTLAEKVER